MATILEFRPQSRTSAGESLKCAAEVVFFPGVRYERWEDEQAPEPAAASKHRDRIDAGGD